MNYAFLSVDTLALIVSVCISVWQHRVLRDYRKADKESAAKLAEQEQLRQSRRDRRDSWESVFRETDEILKNLEDIESEVRAQPADHVFIGRVELGRAQRHLENISGRCPEALRDQLCAVAAAVARLRGVVVLADAEVIARYTEILGSSGEVPPEILADALGAKAVEQYRAAVALHEAIDAAWKAIATERGGDLQISTALSQR
jgi:hypothetical protein